MARKIEIKKLEQIEKMYKELTTHLFNCSKGLTQIKLGEIKRDRSFSIEREMMYRYGIYREPSLNNFIVVDEALLYPGVRCDDVLKSVIYDFLKIDSDGATYARLIDTLMSDMNSFVYLHKAYDPDSWELYVNIEYAIFRNIPTFVNNDDKMTKKGGKKL